MKVSAVRDIMCIIKGEGGDVLSVNGLKDLVSKPRHILLRVGGPASLRVVEYPTKVEDAAILTIELMRGCDDLVCPTHRVPEVCCLLKSEAPCCQLGGYFLTKPSANEV